MGAAQLRELVLGVRRNISYLGAFDSQPVPFMYYHSMCWTVSIVLVMRSFVQAGQAQVFGKTSPHDVRFGQLLWNMTVQFGFVSIINMLLYVSISLSDPFDDGHIPLAKVLRGLLCNVSMACNQWHCARTVAQEVEDDICDRLSNVYRKFELGENLKSVSATGRQFALQEVLSNLQRRS